MRRTVLLLAISLFLVVTGSAQSTENISVEALEADVNEGSEFSEVTLGANVTGVKDAEVEFYVDGSLEAVQIDSGIVEQEVSLSSESTYTWQVRVVKENNSVLTDPQILSIEEGEEIALPEGLEREELEEATAPQGIIGRFSDVLSEVQQFVGIEEPEEEDEPEIDFNQTDFESDEGEDQSTETDNITLEDRNISENPPTGIEETDNVSEPETKPDLNESAEKTQETDNEVEVEVDESREQENKEDQENEEAKGEKDNSEGSLGDGEDEESLFWLRE